MRDREVLGHHIVQRAVSKACDEVVGDGMAVMAVVCAFVDADADHRPRSRPMSLPGCCGGQLDSYVLGGQPRTVLTCLYKQSGLQRIEVIGAD